MTGDGSEDGEGWDKVELTLFPEPELEERGVNYPEGFHDDEAEEED